MDISRNIDFKSLYGYFDHPISSLDCGKRCAPYNEFGLPFCCDTHHIVPTAYQNEWEYLQANTNLWHLWQGKTPEETANLREEVPDGQILIACLGHHFCQRNYRSITCRSFPFYPYITSQGELLGLSCYWEYEDRCWVINNLHLVSHQFRSQFINAYKIIISNCPSEQEEFGNLSKIHRQLFRKQNRGISLLHKDGQNYLVDPESRKLTRVDLKTLPKHDPYEVAALMPFADEKG